MDGLQRASATLIISGDSLTPSEVTALLGVKPTRGTKKGEAFQASHGKQIEARTGQWVLRGGYRSPPDLDAQIAELLSPLTATPDVWADLTKRFECCLSVGAYLNGWTGGITLAPITSKLLADRNLVLDLDLYAPAASE